MKVRKKHELLAQGLEGVRRVRRTLGPHRSGCRHLLPALQPSDGRTSDAAKAASGASMPGLTNGGNNRTRGCSMKLLQMPGKRQSMGAVSADEQEGVLTHVWATDGALAHAVAPVPVTQQTDEERATPVFRKLLAPGTAFYRTYTEAMLRRYGVLSMESGRVPSLLGREMFRGKVTSYRVHAFDDVVIFVHDVDRCIAELEPEQQRLIIRIGVQEYTFEEAASMFRVSLRSVQRRYFQALDELTSIFLRKKLLERIASDPCQEGEATVKLVSHSPEESCGPKFVGM